MIDGDKPPVDTAAGATNTANVGTANLGHILLTDPTNAQSSLRPPHRESLKTPTNTQSATSTNTKKGQTPNSPHLCCHQCKTSKPESIVHVCSVILPSKKNPCRKKYCHPCLSRIYGISPSDLPTPWLCIACEGRCSCAACIRLKREAMEEAGLASSASSASSSSTTLSFGYSTPGWTMDNLNLTYGFAQSDEASPSDRRYAAQMRRPVRYNSGGSEGMAMRSQSPHPYGPFVPFDPSFPMNMMTPPLSASSDTFPLGLGGFNHPPNFAAIPPRTDGSGLEASSPLLTQNPFIGNTPYPLTSTLSPSMSSFSMNSYSQDRSTNVTPFDTPVSTSSSISNDNPSFSSTKYHPYGYSPSSSSMVTSNRRNKYISTGSDYSNIGSPLTARFGSLSMAMNQSSNIGSSDAAHSNAFHPNRILGFNSQPPSLRSNHTSSDGTMHEPAHSISMSQPPFLTQSMSSSGLMSHRTVTPPIQLSQQQPIQPQSNMFPPPPSLPSLPFSVPLMPGLTDDSLAPDQLNFELRRVACLSLQMQLDQVQAERAVLDAQMQQHQSDMARLDHQRRQEYQHHQHHQHHHQLQQQQQQQQQFLQHPMPPNPNFLPHMQSMSASVSSSPAPSFDSPLTPANHSYQTRSQPNQPTITQQSLSNQHQLQSTSSMPSTTSVVLPPFNAENAPSTYEAQIRALEDNLSMLKEQQLRLVQRKQQQQQHQQQHQDENVQSDKQSRLKAESQLSSSPGMASTVDFPSSNSISSMVVFPSPTESPSRLQSFPSVETASENASATPAVAPFSPNIIPSTNACPSPIGRNRPIESTIYSTTSSLFRAGPDVISPSLALRQLLPTHDTTSPILTHTMYSLPESPRNIDSHYHHPISALTVPLPPAATFDISTSMSGTIDIEFDHPHMQSSAYLNPAHHSEMNGNNRTFPSSS